MKQDIGFIGKAFVVIFIFIIISTIAFLVYMGAVNYTLGKAKSELDRVINFEKDFYTCEIHYDNLDYKGRCDDKVWEGFGELIRFDKEMEKAKFCSSSPYSYRMKICS